jgi:hypothetical protein
MYADESSFVDVAYLREEQNAAQRDNTFLRLFVLACTMGNPASSSFKTSSSGNFGANKKAKTAYTTTYSRYFLVADLENPPHCAAILARSSEETSRLLSAINGTRFVGAAFICCEPKPCMQTLGDFLPILELSRSPFLPLCSLASNLDSTESTMCLPRQIGETNYFVLTNKVIALHCVNVCPEQNCMGIQCDRQKNKAGCSCQHTTNHASSVYELDVEFPIPQAIKQAESIGRTATIVGFRSLHTTKFFFQNYDNYCSRKTTNDQQRNRMQIRSKFKAITEFVNTTGGWTIVGWFMMGSVTDAASNASDKIENNVVTIHMTYLYPSNADELENSEELFAKLISLTD